MSKSTNKKRYAVKVRNASVPIDFDINDKTITLEVDTSKGNLTNLAKACMDAQTKLEGLEDSMNTAAASMDFDAVEKLQRECLGLLDAALVVCFGADGLQPVYTELGSASDSDKMDVAMAAFMQVTEIINDIRKANVAANALKKA
jgi:hypothetical protein